MKSSLILQAWRTLRNAALDGSVNEPQRRQHFEQLARPTRGTAIWYLYLIECRNGAYYAGITNDLEARYRAHESGRGARFTRANPPIKLLASAPFPDRASASRAEWKIKQLPREKKLAFITEAQLHGAQ